MSIDVIKIKNTDKKENINNLTSDSLQVGELALVRESNYERLYCKNTDNEIVPLSRIVDGGEIYIPLPTIQEAWIDTGLAQWTGDTAAMNRVRFNSGLTGDFIPPEVSDMDRLTSMAHMFYDCRGLTSLDLSNFDTSKVTGMGQMFYRCSGLTSLDLSNWDTSNVISMHEMFQGCSGLTSLDLSNWDTSKVTDMTCMFYRCPKLTSLDVSNFDTSNVTYMTWIFGNCDKLTKITCKQAFKDWCWDNTNINTNALPTAMREGGSGTWVIVP